MVKWHYIKIIPLPFRSGSRTSTNRERIRCYKCREYNYFAKDWLQNRERNRTDTTDV